MVQEYLTSTGTVTIENNTLYIRRKIRSITQKVFTEILIPLFFVARFIMVLADESSPKRNVRVVFYGFLALISLVPLIYNLFQRSFSNRIPISNIESYKMEDDSNGIEVKLILQLSSGRERIISFRKLENQMEPFVAALEANQIFMEPA